MTPVQVPCSPEYIGPHPTGPRKDNGESHIAAILGGHGFDYLYEAFLYPLRTDDYGTCTFGFTPDFWVCGTKRIPECHIEVTWPDIPTRKQGRHQKPVSDCIAQKRHKIIEVYKLYGVPTLLVDHRCTMAVTKNSRLLPALLTKLHEVKQSPDGYFRPGSHDLKLGS